MSENPLEGKEIRMQEGFVYFPYCTKCDKESMGFHIVEYGEKFDKRDVDGACCVHCGKSKFLEWQLEAASSGEIVMEEGWKSENPPAKENES